jgi:hypothetical protein
MENLTPVTLVVKAPNQKIADQTVECALGWTVKKLKQHLAAVYPSKPIETQQRIIYSGQLLQDHVTLKDVLRQYEPNQTTHTVHLVCSPTTNVDGPSASPSTDASIPANEGLRHRQPYSAETRPASEQSSTATNGTAVLPNSFMYPAHYSPEQMMWMQQMYAQYMAQYMQYYQAGMYSPLGLQPVAYETLINPVANVNLMPNNVNINPGMPVAGAVNRVPVARQAGPEIVRMNAQGGPVVNDDDDDVQNRDWLDWIYVFLRFMILLFILYFYSSFGRIIATMVLVVFIYLYQVGWFQLNRRNVNRPRQPTVEPPVEQQRPQQAPDADVGSDNENAAESADNSSEDTTSSQRLSPQPPSGLAVVWTFVVSFFSSLAPQQPPPVNAN